MVVEITPIGIQSLGWRFSTYHLDRLQRLVCAHCLAFYPETADRNLEDIDRFFREEGRVLVFREKRRVLVFRRDADATKRPERYVDEEAEMRRISSILGGGDNPEAMKRRIKNITRAYKEKV